MRPVSVKRRGRSYWPSGINRRLRAGVGLGCLICLLACGETRKARKTIAPYSGPVEEIKGVQMRYSEAAKLKVKMTTARQLRYVDDNLKYPDPVNIEFYTPAGEVETTLRSDSGRYSKTKDIYTLLGHVVVIKKLTKEKLLTDVLNWSPNTKKVYTDRKVAVLNQLTGEKLYGLGMDAAQDFSTYGFRKVSGVFSVQGDGGF